jgi:membrane-bound lytic murein transglycosylase D
MMHVDFNRSVNFPLMLLVLALAGCSESPQEPISLDDQLPGDASVATYDNEQYQNPESRLHFDNYKAKSSSNHASEWERLFSLYSLPEMDNYRIDREIDHYLQHPASLAVIQQRAEPYLHHILDEIEAKGIPGELALLPVVESAFVVNAYSQADASGLWQFIPSTGEEYGLSQNAWYDGRRDVYASTQAATTYLRELSDLFDGDWLMALASYNCGKNRVRRSIDKNLENNLPADYWSLNLPQETQDYVPRLLAVAKIFANAEAYNLHLKHIPNKPYFEAVNIQSPLDLHKAAQLANTPYDQFLKLNPGFNRSCTAPYGPHRLLIPVEKAQTFKQNLAQLPPSERVNFSTLQQETLADANSRVRQKTVVAKRDDTIPADTNHASPKSFLPVRHDEFRVVHDPVIVERKAPIQSKATLPHRIESKIPEPRHPEPEHHQEEIFAAVDKYKVKPGETLSSIANKHHTTVSALRQANHLPDGNVRWGMALKVPATEKPEKMDKPVKLAKVAAPAAKLAKAQTTGNPFYVVKKGDTVADISERFSVSPKDIAGWNKMKLKSALIPGKKLTIKPANQQLASASSAIRLVHYTAGKGDTLTQIAKKFNVPVSELRKTNAGVLGKGGLQKGQKLKILVDNSST